MTWPELERRARAYRSRWLIRAWEYRQRDHASGVWFRFRRVLVDASEVYAITPAQADELIAEGARPEAVGAELAPPKLLLWASSERVRRIEAARPLAVRLSAELLSAPCLVLVPFERQAPAR